MMIKFKKLYEKHLIEFFWSEWINKYLRCKLVLIKKKISKNKSNDKNKNFNIIVFFLIKQIESQNRISGIKTEQKFKTKQLNLTLILT